jgi:ParB/RepB/Spo0J family partition protein
MSCQEIDLHLIELKYARTRILDLESISKMRRSLERFGQITPVLLVPESQKYILIDGYTRVQALIKLGRDTAWAEISEMQESAALAHFISTAERKICTPLEQASIIYELHHNFQLSLGNIATSLARDKSWVKRRLDLLDSLPGDILDLVRAGHISAWSASRVLAPLARANPKHALSLAQFLAKKTCSTRELQDFFAAYQKAPKKVRERMIDNPALFIKTQKSKARQDQAKALLQSPEDRWRQDMEIVCNILKRLLPYTKTLFACLGREDRAQYQELLIQARALMDNMTTYDKEGKDHAFSTDAGDHPADASKGNQPQGDLQAAQSQQEHCS